MLNIIKTLLKKDRCMEKLPIFAATRIKPIASFRDS